MNAEDARRLTEKNMKPLPDSLKTAIDATASQGIGMVMWKPETVEADFKATTTLYLLGYKVRAYDEDTLVVAWATSFDN